MLLILAEDGWRIRLSRKICSTICAADRFPLTPLIPLAQKRQPTGQPTCELTHAVRRGPSGIITVSALAPLGHVRRSFSVPSELCWFDVTTELSKVTRLAIRSRSALPRFVIWAGDAISLSYTHCRICRPRKRGHPHAERSASKRSGSDPKKGMRS